MKQVGRILQTQYSGAYLEQVNLVGNLAQLFIYTRIIPFATYPAPREPHISVLKRLEFDHFLILLS